jgi:membrane-bound metal-dependent hydrolase YbcI (DUF457 family)
MQGKTHLTIGAAAGAATVAPTGDLKSIALGAVIGGLAALIPDWLQINVPGASKQLKGTFGHRGFSHWAWAALAAAYAARLVWEPAAWPVLAGWASHIILDALASGVPMFWPFGRVTLARVKTGGKLDTAIGAVGLILLVAGAVWGTR